MHKGLRSLIIVATLILVSVGSYWLGRNAERKATPPCDTSGAYANGYAQGVVAGRKVQHHYRFERNGASLWRYDETTGEACQLESNQIDKWIGGRCPPPAEN
jgi:hypothetical protein